jgi:hypothetical protein
MPVEKNEGIRLRTRILTQNALRFGATVPMEYGQQNGASLPSGRSRRFRRLKSSLKKMDSLIERASGTDKLVYPVIFVRVTHRDADGDFFLMSQYN